MCYTPFCVERSGTRSAGPDEVLEPFEIPLRQGRLHGRRVERRRRSLSTGLRVRQVLELGSERVRRRRRLERARVRVRLSLLLSALLLSGLLLLGRLGAEDVAVLLEPLGRVRVGGDDLRHLRIEALLLDHRLDRGGPLLLAKVCQLDRKSVV